MNRIEFWFYYIYILQIKLRILHPWIKSNEFCQVLILRPFAQEEARNLVKSSAHTTFFSQTFYIYVWHSHKRGNEKRAHLVSALIWHQNQVHTPPTFWDMTIGVSDFEEFLWKCDFKKSAFQVSYSN